MSRATSGGLRYGTSDNPATKMMFKDSPNTVSGEVRYYHFKIQRDSLIARRGYLFPMSSSLILPDEPSEGYISENSVARELEPSERDLKTVISSCGCTATDHM